MMRNAAASFELAAASLFQLNVTSHPRGTIIT